MTVQVGDVITNDDGNVYVVLQTPRLENALRRVTMAHIGTSSCHLPIEDIVIVREFEGAIEKGSFDPVPVFSLERLRQRRSA